VPALLQYSLTRAGGGVVENFAALHGSKAGDIAAFDVKDAELSQDTVARRHNDDDAGHIAWLMLLARPAFPLACHQGFSPATANAASRDACV
jgi:hypothetical protein